MFFKCIVLLAFSWGSMSIADAEPPLSGPQMVAFAALALQGVEQEYPNKPANVMDSAADVRSPRQMHPVFFGSFDWHSSVHGCWSACCASIPMPRSRRVSEALLTGN